MKAFLYISAALWVAGWGFIVCLYFAPCKRRCESAMLISDSQGHVTRGLPRRSVRSAFFELAGAFFFVPWILGVYLWGLIRDRHTRRAGEEER